MVILNRCLVLRAADLSPEQLVGVAESVAQLLSPLQGSSDATVVEGTAPGSIHASTTDSLSRRDNHGPIGGTGEVRSEPGADTLVGFRMRPQSGALSNISSAQSRPRWALQLYRALALHAHLHSGKYSTEQLLRLVKASQRSGFVSIALFTDAIQRYVLMVDEESADLSDLHCLLTALATTRKESPGGRNEVMMFMYNRKLQGLLLKAWQHQKLHHGAQQLDMLPACQVAELYWSLQVTSGPISAPPQQQQQDQGFAIGVLASELAGLLPFLDLRSKIRLSQTFLSSMAELDAGEVTAAKEGRTKAFGEAAAAASRQSSAMISAVHKGISTLLQALFEEVVHILATRAGSLGTLEAMEKTSAEACTNKEVEAGSLSSQHPGSTNIKGFELPAEGVAEGGVSPEAEEDALCISDVDVDDDDSGGGGPEEADEMVDGGSVESKEGFFADDGPLGTTIMRQPSLMVPRASPFSVNQYIAHVSAAYLGQGGNDCTFIDMLAKHCLARAKSNVAVRTRPSLALFSKAPSAECMDGMEVSLLSQALSLSLLGILSERTPSLPTHSMSSSVTSTPLQDQPSSQQFDEALQLSSSQASLQLVLSAVSVLAVSAPGLTGTLASCPDQQSLERAVSAFLLIRDTLERYRSSPGSGSGLLDAKEALETEHACDRAAKAGSVKMKRLIEGRKGYRKSQGYHKLTF
ncbi:hypothetical protein CEUSTIGMA_g4201.t1 [Chlamydomonas eustigma]|uniref:Uncharacterized protein n=1 Tax=Chlamydomonas eustigma TaxID=1157962 RepID=A0A250X0X6_9CHLO|nr:hypothetical protein CEUSTIGMA_g4201.t1 [Chlamydomonas eustigma]|eukprot:GAX76754.1 hypothetical protein CEUSTIGMA_g4201.t1 [Chlamydomonas eustigma]